MSRFVIPIIFIAKPYTDFSACRVLLFEIQMWFGAFAPCINRGDRLYKCHSILQFLYKRYKRTFILLVTVFNIDEYWVHFLRDVRVKKYREIESRLVRLLILRVNVQYGVIPWWRTGCIFQKIAHTAIARKNHEKLFLPHLELNSKLGSNLLG